MYAKHGSFFFVALCAHKSTKNRLILDCSRGCLSIYPAIPWQVSLTYVCASSLAGVFPAACIIPIRHSPVSFDFFGCFSIPDVIFLRSFPGMARNASQKARKCLFAIN